MLARDRLFLQEYARCGYLTHIATAAALFQAYSAPKSLVDRVEHAFSRSQESYPTTKLGRAGRHRLQSIYVARLFAEQMAAIEDLGAFGWAIQHRNEGGIFKRYLESQTRDVGNFFSNISNCANEMDVLPLLKLPSLSELQQILPSDTFTDMEMDKRYQEYGLALKTMAELYRTTAVSDPSVVIDNTKKVHIVIDVGDTGRSMAPSRSDVYVHTYNRIKHRFAVIESLEPFSKIPDKEKPVFYSHLSLRPEHANHHVIQIAAIATIGCDLADFLLLIDGHGYPL